MDSTKLHQYLVYEARLASFSKTAKKRGSSAGGRSGKVAAWPHKQIAPASLAKAGFYFDPTPTSPDNVVCFLCAKGLDGWEAGDDPLLEHLKHAPDCGWATVAAIEAEVGEYGAQDPISPHMVEARKATFGEWWPHEGKKGWKCKTKQLADAGWKYTPTAGSDDMATCAYCQLALDGWEPGDKPYEEHFSRSPDCAFFTLVDQFGGAKKRTARTKVGRGSKASRISAQSTASDRLSAADTTAGAEDSVLTMTQGGRKVRAKKAAAGKASRSKAKKKDGVVAEATDEQEEQQQTSRQKPVKATRGRKRGSEALDDSSASLLAPPKKRATRTRSSTVTNASTVVADDSEMVDAAAPVSKAVGRRGRQTSSTQASRQPSAISMISSASVASLRAPTGQFSDDDEIERQLEADLARDWDEDEDQPGLKDEGAADCVMAENPCPVAADDDDAVDDELRALQAEMRMDEPEQQLRVAKKGRKAAVGKASGQTKPSRTKTASPPAEERPLEEEADDVSVGSTDTVVKNAGASQPAVDTDKERGRQGRSRSWLASRSPAAEEVPARQCKESQPCTELSSDKSTTRGQGSSPPRAEAAQDGQPAETEIVEDREAEQQTDNQAREAMVQPSTPAPTISPAPSARQPALSPSPSPQSSDAENQPPSSRAATSVKRTVPSQTPSRAGSRNVLAGLQTTAPWSAASLDALLKGTPPPLGDDDDDDDDDDDKENNGHGRFLPLAGRHQLSTPEKAMTVEQWIYFNAGQAEAKLRLECEALVSRFEREGTRAMQALEGLSAE
ncbi:hypothetical protein XA68_16926 [Ophiocordyceps unilateralis]|uniref:BIR-domain-containing protein n=1 Tax=Ophiocordyceps unilateralis TaxID=268505 RepID=A0A2A9P5M8_OPHUN|nr:hypothetical protein XA68_16926 [Ophiocordyceps unilateralis]